MHPLNRLYDPANAKLGRRALSSPLSLARSAMTSKRVVIPTTCGYLYCIASSRLRGSVETTGSTRAETLALMCVGLVAVCSERRRVMLEV